MECHDAAIIVRKAYNTSPQVKTDHEERVRASGSGGCKGALGGSERATSAFESLSAEHDDQIEQLLTSRSSKWCE
jgi:hypothetical protein